MIGQPPLLPLMATDPVAAGVWIAACLIWLVPEMIAMPRQMAKHARKSASRQDRRSLGVLLGLQWAGIALNFLLGWFYPEAAIPWPRTALFWSGFLLIVLGVAFRWYAIWTLGRYFTRDVAVSADQPVIQAGPYRIIRHPAYSGTLITMLGLGLTTANWAGLIVLLGCAFLGHSYRVAVEEKALIQAIGRPYLEYMQRTGRFIPRLFSQAGHRLS
jgi:protein-S-isoprenylcysteine O-methyltransferase Ste14